MGTVGPNEEITIKKGLKKGKPIGPNGRLGEQDIVGEIVRCLKTKVEGWSWGL